MQKSVGIVVYVSGRGLLPMEASAVRLPVQVLSAAAHKNNDSQRQVEMTLGNALNSKASEAFAAQKL